ncbi:unnamed protein product [Mycena citricolor]|uniref:Uncharacterized protein n=1 Tax=Mycena citricolor TaxID=2018698 RepID=A0AAD2HD20_9AGAR|nr:unnamed protein product [Mycena citricolor]
MSDIPQKRVLPSKESGLFKELLSLYETRQLKKGLKTADQILKKFPEHGETTCMKGLIITHMGRREEGLDLVKKGVRLDLTSHICWHVYGLIHKGEKNYEEALKCYTQALKFDKVRPTPRCEQGMLPNVTSPRLYLQENMNILRDAAHLQTQLRLYDGLVETRHAILKSRPNLRQHWVGLAVAHHLNGNLADAKKVLDYYEGSLKNIPDYDVEHSETLLYHVRLLEEMGELTEALTLLDVNAKERAIVDRTAIMEIRARLLTKLSSEEAEQAWKMLVEHNPENYGYYRGYLSNLGLSLDPSDPQAAKALASLEDLSSQLPKATAPRRLALTLATGEHFRELLTPYLTRGLEKGVPSLFSDIKGLCLDPSKQATIEDVAETALKQYNPAKEVEPTSYLWTLYFLAQHHSYLGHHQKALEVLEIALEHTPTLPELLMLKGRVLKRAGDLYGGARCLEDARLLDGQDRFLNTKSAKYRLRAGMVEEASQLLGLFTKKDAPSPGADLEDMQSLFYLVEEANAHNRNGALGFALKKYMAVKKVFDDVEDDQYDFHGYSLRKFTISIYLNMLKWEDHLRSHPAYVTSALSASRIFVRLHDDPSLASGAGSNAQLTDAQKKAKKKAKKAAEKVKEDAKKAATTQQNNNEDKGLEPPQTDDDPDGTKLVQCKDPLDRALKLLRPLLSLEEKNIQVWIVSYDVAFRRKKYLQAAKALLRAAALDPEDPELHIRRVELQQTVTTLPASAGDTTALLKDSVAKLLPTDVSLEAFNSQYLQRHSTSAPAVLAVSKVSAKLGAPADETVFSVFNPDVTLTVKDAQSILSYLTETKSPRADEFRTRCADKFVLSTVFRTAKELEQLKAATLAARVVDDKVDPEEVA